jgi:hypothetical protein
MYNCNCVTIPFDKMRYATAGDYFTEGGVTQFRIASMGNSNYEFLVFLHEIIEKQLAKAAGITEQMVDAWDLSHEDAKDPGSLEGCPYKEAHLIAEGFERAMASKLGVDWAVYCEAVDAAVHGTSYSLAAERKLAADKREKKKIARRIQRARQRKKSQDRWD